MAHGNCSRDCCRRCGRGGQTVGPLGWCSLIGLLVLLACLGQTQATMDITAFEYFRKFGKHLELGECPQREIVVTLPNKTSIVKTEMCTARQQGNVTNVPRELNDTRHVIIPTADDLVAYLGLCGGDAASYLGILNQAGDCVAVEIASKLSFNRKTMVRAYVEYYRKSLDILDTPNSAVREGFSLYMADKFYVKNRSYGTLEIILVQFRFQSRKQTALAKDLKMTSHLMSDYMRKVEREVGIPKSVLVLCLSTATDETYTATRYAEQDWGSAVRTVVLRELTIGQRRKLIDSGKIRPNLNYQLFPFVARNPKTYRLSSPLTWEATSMLEVSLRVSVGIAKKTAKMCRKNRTKPCRLVRELRRKLVALQAEIHAGRANWLELSTSEQQEFATRYKARVATFSSVTKRLSREVRRARKQAKLERVNARKRSRNQVPQVRRVRRLKHKRDRPHLLHRLARPRGIVRN